MSHSTSVRPQAQSRASYLVFRTLGTRWSDNDAYGHVNNVVYYNWFDTAVNAHLVEHGALDIHLGDTIGLVVQSSCNFFRRWPSRKLSRSACACRAWGRAA